MNCIYGYEIKVVDDGESFYYGTYDREGLPNCRLSCYAKTKKEAKRLPLSRMFDSQEVVDCNQGRGCFKSGTKPF